MKPIDYADRVKETTTTVGTGNLTLAGAVAGFSPFDANLFGSFYYLIDAGAAWEVGVGNMFDATTLVRDAVISSSTGTKLSLASGTKQVSCVSPALGFRRAEVLIGGSGLAECETTDALATDFTTLELGVLYSTFKIETGTAGAIVGRILVTARDFTSGDTKSFEVTFTAKVVAGTLSLVGTPTVTTLHADAAAAPWGVSLDVFSNLLRLRGTGEAAKTIIWKALLSSVRA